MGMEPKDIDTQVRKMYPDFRREYIYRFLREAGKRGHLKYQPPPHIRYQEQLRNHHRWLRDASVVRTTYSEHVAQRAALALLRLVTACHTEQGSEDVHIGFAGGHAMRAVTRAFADLLCEPAKDLPKRIVFHAMVAGFQPEDPTTEPNTFFTYMLEPTIQIEPRFQGLSAPSIVYPEDMTRLKELPEIAEAFEAAKQIDIIVTSGADWLDEHSALQMRMKRSEESIRILREHGCVGDLLWRPIAEDGPIEVWTELRALTLVELSDLPAFIRNGKHVLLMLGPCALCNRPKGDLLRAILNQRTPLITELVVDSKTASRALLPEGKEAVDH
jgi:DNA-binding transcriptional regulator LsrR (DeoR family)